MKTYPKKLLENIYWSFDNGKYSSYDEFIENLIEYNLKINHNVFDFNCIILEESLVNVAYSYYDEEEDDSVDIDFSIEANDKKSFTLGELLFKIHNEVVDHLEEDEHKFLQGLTLFEDVSSSQHPFYLLGQGS
jgi:hypothetical protein